MAGLNETYPKGHENATRRKAWGSKRGGSVPYWRLFYHVVWATRGRLPLLQPRHEALVEETIRTVCRERGVIAQAVGVMPDHVHVVASIPPSQAIGDIVGQWKGAASHRLPREGDFGNDEFSWRKEYGVHSVGERAWVDVLSYVRDQPERHRLGRVWTALERIDERGPVPTASTLVQRSPNGDNVPPADPRAPLSLLRALQRPSDGEPGH